MQQNIQQNRWVIQNCILLNIYSHLTERARPIPPILRGIIYSIFCNTGIHMQATLFAFSEYCCCMCNRYIVELSSRGRLFVVNYLLSTTVCPYDQKQKEEKRVSFVSNLTSV